MILKKYLIQQYMLKAQPFEKYLDDAYDAPEIIKKVCSEILLKAK